MPSSAEPTHPGPPGDDHPPAGPHTHAKVIQLARRGLRRGRRHPTPAIAPDQPVTPQQQLAETVEATFHRAGGTLTDEAPAHTYRVTLGLVNLMLEGAHATEVVSAEQHETLRHMIEGMIDAPNEL